MTAGRLGVVFNLDEGRSREVAAFYTVQRRIPAENLIGIHLPTTARLNPEGFNAIRAQLLGRLPTTVQSLLLVWSAPYAVGCMSITSAVAAGYSDATCGAPCSRTPRNPLFDSVGWLPADTLGWWPAMLMPSDDVEFSKRLIRRGVAADASMPVAGTLYLVRTSDIARNVRAATYGDVALLLGHRLGVMELRTPIMGNVPDAIGYFTGTTNVDEMPRIQFLPGAIADHLTSSGGILEGGRQMSALSWLRQGATATYGSVSEPCSYPEKFPNVPVLFTHYTHGETVLESYWKSVLMAGQGLFVGEPLSRPFASSSSVDLR